MSRAVRVLKGVAALLALVGLVVGVPLFLVQAAGWPLPGHLPSPQALGDALTRNGVPAEVIVNAVAVVIWIAWAQLVLSVAIEVVALVRHRQLGRVRGLGASRMLAASLVTASAALLSVVGSLRPAGAVVAPRPRHRLRFVRAPQHRRPPSSAGRGRCGRATRSGRSPRRRSARASDGGRSSG